MDKKREDLETILGAVKITKSYILQNLVELAKVEDEFSEYEKTNLGENLTTTLQVLQGLELSLNDILEMEDIQ